MITAIPLCCPASSSIKRVERKSYSPVFKVDDYLAETSDGVLLDHELCRCRNVSDSDIAVFESLIKSRLLADERARKSGNHSARVMMREPEHRLPLLIELSRGEPLIRPELAWKYARKTWVELKEVFPYQSLWEEFFSLNLPRANAFMSADEVARLKALPDEIKIYRGYKRSYGRAGLSWTMSKRVATHYADQFKMKKIAQAVVPKELVAGIVCCHGEFEVVLKSLDSAINQRAVNAVKRHSVITLK